MEKFDKFNDLRDLPIMDHCSASNMIANPGYYHGKRKKIRMFDENRVIKQAGYRLDFLNMLKDLDIENVNTPLEIMMAPSKNIQGYYIISKYLKDCVEMDSLSYHQNDLKAFIILLIKLTELVKKCHDKDFYLIDLHYSNVLVNPLFEPFLFDFDSSMFIRNNQIYAQDGSLKSLIADYRTGYVLNRYYGIDEEKEEYNIDLSALKPCFAFIDKQVLVEMIVDILQYKKGAIDNLYDAEYTIYDIRKLGLPWNIERKLISVLVDKETLDDDDYLLDELNELKESRLIRSRKFR